MKTVAGSMIARKKEETNIDLTPMLDVVFILLIFFVVTASFLKETAIGVHSSDDNQEVQPPTDKQNILFKISANNDIWLNNRHITIKSVRANVERLLAENPKASVILQPDDASKVDTLVSIMNSAREAKRNISISVVGAKR